jgi:glycine/D-amino acid oxidase-like deaminating enzyme
MPIGYWEREYLLPPADLTVVGAGIVGMSTALHFKAIHPNSSVRIVERDILGEGGTTRNAGFACFGGPGEWLDDIAQLGEEAWLRLIRMRAQGLRELIQLLGAEAIGLEWSGGWELFPGHDRGAKRDAEVRSMMDLMNGRVTPILREELSEFHPAGADTPAVAWDDEKAAHFGAHSAVHLCWEGMLNTGRMVQSFHKALDRLGVQRLHGFDVQGLDKTHGPREGWSLTDGRRSLPSRHVAICTNGFAESLMPGTPAVAVPNRVLVLRPRKPLPNGTYHAADGYLYFRTLQEGRVLFGGGRHFNLSLPPHPQRDPSAEAEWDQRLLESAESWLGPIEAVEDRWTGWLGVGQDRMPLLGSSQPGLHHAVRLGGMGVAIGCGIGRQLAVKIGDH